MNKDKVYLKGYVIGRAADTLGYEGLMVQLENLDIVEIDKNLVYKEIDESQPIKLKDVITRIKDFDSGTQKVWLNEILNELGSDYGTLKYKAGYEQGKFDGAIEREKVTVPQFVADWIEYCKEHNFTLFGCLDPVDVFGTSLSEGFKGDTRKCIRWCRKESNKFARAWLDGYTVEKEKRYRVKMKGLGTNFSFLNLNKAHNHWMFSSKNECDIYQVRHTRKELEEAGFDWVFDCPGIEIEEVE